MSESTHTTMRMTKGPIVGLEAIRAIAALVVLINHVYHKVDGFPRFVVFDFATNYAVEAVIAFFVLSGTVLTLKQRDEIGPYLLARGLRIMPIYYVCLVLTLFVSVWTGYAFTWPQLLGNVFFLQNLQGDIVSPPAANMALWSLSYEMMFYLAFPLVLMGSGRRQKLYLTLVLSLLTGLLWSKLSTGVGPIDFVISVFAMYCLWLIGAIVNDLVESGIHISTRTALILFAAGLVSSRTFLGPDFYDIFRLFAFGCGVGAIVWLIVQREKGENGTTLFDLTLWQRFYVIGAAIVFLNLASPSATLTKVVLSMVGLALFVVTALAGKLGERYKYILDHLAPSIVYLGSISYAIYAVHMPVLYAFEHFSNLPALLRGGLTVLVTFLLAHFLERLMQPVFVTWVRHLVRPKT